jgi:hypothetical protein
MSNENLELHSDEGGRPLKRLIRWNNYGMIVLLSLIILLDLSPASGSVGSTNNGHRKRSSNNNNLLIDSNPYFGNGAFDYPGDNPPSSSINGNVESSNNLLPGQQQSSNNLPSRSSISSHHHRHHHGSTLQTAPVGG